MVKGAYNVLIHTGGTFSMGYDERHALTPLYDVRLEILAMKILELRMPAEMERGFLDQLVASRELILEMKALGKEKQLKSKITAKLDDIAGQLSLVTGGDIDIVAVMQEYRIHSKIEQPYVIDSIDFDYGEHLAKLRTPVFAALEKGMTAIVILGSDTIEYVAPLLSKEAKQKGLLDNGTILFVTSMLSFADHPAHVARLLQAALEVSSNHIPGAYALSARDEAADCVHVHDVTHGFAKISTSIVNLFRSTEPVGIVSQSEGFQANPLRNITGEHNAIFMQGTRAPVAPPMVLKEDLMQAVHYLETSHDEHVLFDVDHWPEYHESDTRQLMALIRERKAAGRLTLFINPLVFDIESDRVSSRFNDSAWTDHKFMQAVRAAGGATASEITVNDAYGEMLLFVGEAAKGKKLNGMPTGDKTTLSTTPLLLHYVADHTMMTHALKRAGSFTSQIELYNIPGGVMPSSLVPILETLGHKGVKVLSGFEIDKKTYPTLDDYKLQTMNEKAVKRNKLNYAAARAFLTFAPKQAIRQITSH
ncbi:MAG: hypothetical protein EB060_03130 [Proteobacteria bacterium]|nr:hypothetical protein [Pseudomonadota bacterium]